MMKKHILSIAVMSFSTAVIPLSAGAQPWAGIEESCSGFSDNDMEIPLRMLQAADLDEDGILSIIEIDNTIRQILGGGQPGYYMNENGFGYEGTLRYFTLDKDCDGRVSMEEYLIPAEIRLHEFEESERIRYDTYMETAEARFNFHNIKVRDSIYMDLNNQIDQFDILDKDGDGYLSRDEYDFYLYINNPY